MCPMNLCVSKTMCPMYLCVFTDVNRKLIFKQKGVNVSNITNTYMIFVTFLKEFVFEYGGGKKTNILTISEHAFSFAEKVRISDFEKVDGDFGFRKALIINTFRNLKCSIRNR
jgi:hypothetical protein